jgi:threonine dehydrogenase-like Zn-dependent dehydrogenase
MPGRLVTGFSFPVVPRGKARIRTQMSAAHTPNRSIKGRGDLRRPAASLGSSHDRHCSNAPPPLSRPDYEGVGQAGAPLHLGDDRTDPGARPDEVLIRVKRTAICGTDIHIYNWDDGRQRRPGADDRRPRIRRRDRRDRRGVTRDLKVGQRVSARAMSSISTATRRAPAASISIRPPSASASTARAPSPTIVVIPAFNVVPLPDDVSDDVGAILDPFGNAVHTAQQFDLMGEDVLVTGAGPIGIMAAAVARRAGARSVVLTDINDFRLELAQKVAPASAR